MRIFSSTATQSAEKIVLSFTMPSVQRKKRKKLADITKYKGGPIIHYVNLVETGFLKQSLKSFQFLNRLLSYQQSIYLSIPGHSSFFVLRNSYPNWSGFMIKIIWPSRPELQNTLTASLQKSKTPSLSEYPRYSTNQSDSEIPVMLKFWRMQRIPLLPSLPSPLWPGVAASDKVLSMG